MNKHTLLISMAAALTAATGAQAADKSWYVSGQVGVRAVEQQTIDGASLAIDLEQHNGLHASVALGRYFDQTGVGFRGEIESAWRDGGRINRFSVNQIPVSVSGDGLSALSVMANGIVDFNNSSRFTPYIGAGVGVVSLHGDIDAGANRIDDSTTAFGVQGIAGVDIRVSDAVSIFTDLRYLKAIDPSLTLAGSAGSADVSVAYDAYSVGAGLRFRF